jgi:hypothetical protein
MRGGKGVQESGEQLADLLEGEALGRVVVAGWALGH